MKTISEIFSNRILWTAIISWFIAQLIKVLIEISRKRKINLSLFISSGGMPSSHTSFVVALCIAIGLSSGFDSEIFAVAAMISLVVMYDAAGVRRAAGKQAEVLNMLVESLENSGVKLDKKLKELLGHSPIEVMAGMLLGTFIAIILRP